MEAQGFAERVIELVSLIPEGRVSTYGTLAKYIGTGGSARTVGYILGKSIEGHNVPAHRVVNSAGLLSGRLSFSKDDPMEDRLIREGVQVKNFKVVNFKELLWDPAIEL